MHRLAATPGGWNPETEGVIFVEQTPAPIIFLTAADTDLQTLATAADRLPEHFPDLRGANLLQLQQQLAIDTYADDVLRHARVIVLRILGGRSYWRYGLEVTQDIARLTGADLIVLPGDDRPDPDLMGYSTVSLTVANRFWRYFIEGGVENTLNALLFLADTCLGCDYHPPQPVAVPRVGVLGVGNSEFGVRNGGDELSPLITDSSLPATCPTDVHSENPESARVAILFYRAHYLAGNIAPIDALCQALRQRQLEPVPIFVSSLRDLEVRSELAPYLASVQLILNTTGFAISQGKIDAGTRGRGDAERKRMGRQGEKMSAQSPNQLSECDRP
ncbi:MAG: cobaltochelatase subunit CobN, partial [Cyanobacteriota bacterium]|nr:cobaltochelatase subunit CobN [Cyanobacteriota bacterium]